ncbi:hypothetical protein [Algoriphagus hitonicola]|uniref:Uncharacterized protein n=1 Tax=Algoriphagus hitonicola TaxID=435880 RepID=A0A1I2R5F9_9BACT|nr:hypothetical protein [Algoriphagus hitonicola]SFG35293.1 hypothetical protein SAMN04487988_10362 [Algoriphagus hitonicola]
MTSTLTHLIAVFYFLMLSPFFPTPGKITKGSDTISIRESTIDYQLRVGDRLFVFGKKSAGLEKIKVGMRMLDFYQQSKNEESVSDQSLKWSRQSDGSVVLEKWSDAILHSKWTVFTSGQIQFEKMVSADHSFDLGFRFLDERLFAYNWQKANQAISTSTDPIDVSEISSKEALRIEQFDRLNLNFEDLSVKITPMDQPVLAEILPSEDLSQFKAISFKSFSNAKNTTKKLEQPSTGIETADTIPFQSLKLNFEFYL